MSERSLIYFTVLQPAWGVLLAYTSPATNAFSRLVLALAMAEH